MSWQPGQPLHQPGNWDRHILELIYDGQASNQPTISAARWIPNKGWGYHYETPE